MSTRDESLGEAKEGGELAEGAMEPGPLRTPFTSDLGIIAGDAVARARHAAFVAKTVYAEVKDQAVHELLRQRRSIRSIAVVTGIPKSEVGRIARRLRAAPESVIACGAAPGTSDEIRDAIAAAWARSGWDAQGPAAPP